MPVVTISVSWFSLALPVGGVGGLLNALHTNNLRPWPAFATTTARKRRVTGVGLLGNVCVASLAASLCVWGLAGLGSFIAVPSDTQLLALLGTSLLIGFGAARLATNEADNRLLHQAVCQASAAPAAPPDTVRAMETAQPWAIYAATEQFMPPPAATWRIGR